MQVPLRIPVMLSIESPARPRSIAGREQLPACVREQRLVRGDDVASLAQSAPDIRARGVYASDQLDQQMALVDHVDGIRGQQTSLHAFALFLNVAHEDPADAQIDSVARANSLPLAVDEAHESLPHRSASEQTDGHLAHATLLATSACSRSSIRSRTSSRPTESRIKPSPMPTLLRTSGSIEACVIVGG